MSSLFLCICGGVSRATAIFHYVQSFHCLVHFICRDTLVLHALNCSFVEMLLSLHDKANDCMS